MFEKIVYAAQTAKRHVSEAVHNYTNKSTFIQEGEIPGGDVIIQVLNSVYEKHKVPSVKLVPKGYGIANETETCFYGYPRYVDGDIPTDSSGKQLRFMAQVNCNDLSSLPNYPHTGLLQFWVQGEKYVSFFDCKDPKAYQVIYIKNPVNNNIKNVEIDEALYDKEDAGDFPFMYGKSLDIRSNVLFGIVKEDTTPSYSDFNVMLKLIDEEYENITGTPITPEIKNQIKDVMYDDKRFKGSWSNRVGGYPSFTQNGPADRDKLVLLLQLDSCSVGDIDIMWGDSGIAGFFISPDDLKIKIFNNVTFYWDCC